MARIDEITEEQKDELKNWAYISDFNKMIHIHDKTIYGKRHSSHIMGLFMDVNPAIEKGLIQVVKLPTYLPNDERDIIPDENDENIKYINMCQGKIQPKADPEYTEEGKKYIKTFEKHMGLLCNSHLDGGKDAKIFMQWIAWQIQNTGIRLKWCPILCTVEDQSRRYLSEVFHNLIGKCSNPFILYHSVFHDLYRSIKDSENCWAVNKSIVIIDFDHSNLSKKKQELIEKYMTDECFLVHTSGKILQKYTTKNAINFIIFTLNKDILRPNKDNNKRFWLIKNAFENREDLAKEHGMSYNDLFSYLFDDLEKNVGQLKKWLLEYEITEEFKNLTVAPKSI